MSTRQGLQGRRTGNNWDDHRWVPSFFWYVCCVLNEESHRFRLIFVVERQVSSSKQAFGDAQLGNARKSLVPISSIQGTSVVLTYTNMYFIIYRFTAV